jgi:hypothetical protein
MNNSVQVKQADVVLLTYPLDYGENGYSPADKQLDLDFVGFGGKIRLGLADYS